MITFLAVSLPHISLFLLIALLYILPVVFFIYWMVKMLKNSNENLKLTKEILERLKS
ncbi:hypothetical protein [Halpernia frigidisoli]|uniref:Uncharacterized protein n=1 Tax=Halpernia frigidisoli TaxID=1125876 RepID=A0A1I3CT96_9FLAO|nr:hypothetical protein [Halpernia frigidisoli]SFH77461.1 hypothetical protein SAMN05443292_0053 [Halpernia frigidisoli]